MHIVIGLSVIMTAMILGIRAWIRSLPPKRKLIFKSKLGSFWLWCEKQGYFARTPTYQRNYANDYPHLKKLEDRYQVILKECLSLLEIKDDLIDINVLEGDFTAGRVSSIRWKSLMFKSGKFIEENCALCPQTAELLRHIPGLYNSFFSVLDPKQYIKPHWGYYKGFVRYHLGIIIPNNNEDKNCFLRINDNHLDNSVRDKTLIDRGEKYYWKNGEGVIFDDTFLHDAANNSEQVRVVLFLDIRRKMPWFLQILNILVLTFAFKDPSISKIRQRALVVRGAKDKR